MFKLPLASSKGRLKIVLSDESTHWQAEAYVDNLTDNSISYIVYHVTYHIVGSTVLK